MLYRQHVSMSACQHERLCQSGMCRFSQGHQMEWTTCSMQYVLTVFCVCNAGDLGFGIGTAADGSITCVPCKTPGCTMCAANYTICQSCNPKDYESQPVEGVCKANWYNMTGGVTSANFMINATVCSPKSLSDVQTALAQAMWPLQQRLPAQNVSNVVFAIASQTGCPGPCTTTASIIISVSSSLAYGLEVKSYLSGLLPAPGQAVAVPQVCW